MCPAVAFHVTPPLPLFPIPPGEIDFDLPCPDGPFIDPLGSSSVPLHGDLQATAARDEYQGLHEGLAKQEQEQTQDQQLLPHINAGIYTDSGDEDDGFGDSPSGDDHDGAAPGGRPWDGGDGTRTGELGKRKRGGDGGRSSPAAAGAAVAMSPWETAVDRLSGDSESEDGGASEEDDGLDDGECAYRFCLLLRIFFRWHLARRLGSSIRHKNGGSWGGLPPWPGSVMVGHLV